MYFVIKELEIAGAHQLQLNYESKCSNLHGHNWNIKIYCKAKELDENNMVTDFTRIKKVVTDKLDHKYINNVISGNPTAEHIAEWICNQIKNCYKVEVQESAGNKAIYISDN